MRCKYCDFSEEGTRSLYNQGLKHRGRSGKRQIVTLDKKTGDPICTVCQEEVNQVFIGIEIQKELGE